MAIALLGFTLSYASPSTETDLKQAPSASRLFGLRDRVPKRSERSEQGTSRNVSIRVLETRFLTNTAV